jgi:hypothetical protein
MNLDKVRVVGILAVVAPGFWLAGGCSRDPHLVDETIRAVVVESVEDSGVRLDQNAEPVEVVYVLLRAMHDDFKAGDDRAARQAAFDRQLSICAPDTIIADRPGNLADSYTRDEYIHKLVWSWTPLVSHYVDQFPADLASAGQVVSIRQRNGGERETAVAALVLQDPTGATTDAKLEIELVKEGGFWRVAGMGWAPANPVR